MGDAVVDVWVLDTTLTTAIDTAREPRAVDSGVLHAGVLDADERERVGRLADEVSARAYVALHVLARVEIGRVLGRRPESVRFDRTCPDCGRQHGRPRLLDDPGLHVSLSRSGSVVALALARSGPVGVDVEHVAGTRFEGFGQVALHPRERASGEAPAPRDPGADADADAGSDSNAESDATSWVRKEAALKALGLGLRVDPTSFVTPTVGTPTGVVPGLAHVTVTDLDAPAGCVAAVAVVAGSGAVEICQHRGR